MSLFKIKVFEWIVDDISIIKIESINSYLNESIIDKSFTLDIGMLRETVANESDMIFDEDIMELQLNDNTDYWVTFNESTDLIDVVTLQELLKKTIEGKGILNSKNYVGRLDLDLSGFHIIIKSRKVNYDRDFNFLRYSISEFCSDLLSRSSSYFTEHFSKGSKARNEEINYSEIAYVRDLLSPEKLPAWIDYFIYHAEHKYEKLLEKRNLSVVDDVESELYLNGLCSGELFETKRVIGRAGKYGKAPFEIDSYTYEMTYDTNENRFVKFFVFYIKDFLNEILNESDASNKKLIHEIALMLKVLDEKTENPFWNKISNMERIPYDSQMLQKKYPYNMIFQAYTEFELASEIDLGEIDRKYAVGQKDAPMLYQYWVFIMLFKHLKQMYKEKYVTSDWITYDGKNLTFTLTEGRKSFAKFFVNDDTELHLLYNKTYDRKHVTWAGRSYSHELKPDISIEMFKGGDLVSIIHFDAKYRLPLNGTDVPDDINKMHAYKDGIIGTIGSYAVCLADERVIYPEEEMGCEVDSIFPSVGACPLNLNPQTLDKELNDIMYIVDEFTKIELQSNTNRFSQKHLVKYSALMREMMKIKE